MPRLLRTFAELEPNRHFVKLWLSQLLSLTAFNMVNFTLLIRVFELTNSTTLVSIFVLSFGLPSLLFGAVAGVFADRWNRRTVLVVTNLLRSIVVLAYLLALSNLPAIYGITFVMATITQFFTPAEGALIPELVERKRLVAANAIFMVTMFASFVLGYGLAGPLAATGGDNLPIQVAAVMFAIATVTCATLPRISQPRIRVPLRKAYKEVALHLREGLRFVAGSRPVRYGLSQLTFIWSTIGVVMVLVPAYTAEVLNLNLREVSRLIIVPIGIGMLAGGYLLNKARRHYGVRPIVLVSLLMAGLMLGTLGQVVGLAHWLVEHNLSLSSDQGVTEQIITSTAATLLGLSLSMVMIAAQTLIHERSTAALRGRVFGVLGTSINAANTIPVLLAGVLTDIFRVSTIISAVGASLLLWAAFSVRLSRPTSPLGPAGDPPRT